MTILEDAKKGIITDEMKAVAKAEGVTEDFIRRGMAQGHIVIPISPYRDVKVCGIGQGLRTKVNCSIGTSSDIVDIEMEVEKAKAGAHAGADTLMELSTGGDFYDIRRRVVEATPLSVGSVPLYQAFIEASRKDGAVVHLKEDDLFRITEEQASTAHLYVAKLLTQPSYGRSLYTPSSSSRDEGDFYLTVSCACMCVCVCVCRSAEGSNGF